jgi:photosystem II stability/assembly factor-like uncharacterized protein
MAKAGLLFVATDDGITLYSEPGAMGRWLRVGQELRGTAIQSVWVWADNPTQVIAASADTLFRTEDGGSSWEVIERVPGGLLAGSRSAQANVWCLASDGALWHSSNAGISWNQLAAFEMTGTHLLTSATDLPEYLAIAAGASVQISMNAGNNWQHLANLPGDVTQLVYGTGSTLYAVTQGQLLHYADDTWQAIAPDLQPAGGLAILAGREPVLLAATAEATIVRSSNGGASWELTTNEAGWTVAPTVITHVPYHMDTAFAGAGPAIAISTDRGRTWQRLKGELPIIRAIAAARLV